MYTNRYALHQTLSIGFTIMKIIKTWENTSTSSEIRRNWYVASVT